MKKIHSSPASAQRPKFTYQAKGRYWRFRHRLTGDRALPGNPGEPEFHRQYSDFLAEIQRLEGRPSRTGPALHSLSWFVREYRASPEYRQLAARSRRDYDGVMDHLEQKAGDLPLAKLTRAAVLKIRDTLSEGNIRKANYAVQVISILSNWGINRQLLKENQAKGIKKLKLPGKGYKPWSEPEIAKAIAEFKPHVRLGLILHLYTGQRAGDVIRMERERYLGGEVECRQQKTNELLPIATPRQLREALDARPFPDAPTLLVQENGRSYSNETSWMKALKREVIRIGLSNELSSHGLRYAAAARLEESGQPMGVIVALVGHRSYQMGMQYATKRRNSQQAARVIEERY
jgi:integrase